MNLTQIIDMVSRIFVRKGVNWGIKKGTRLLGPRAKPAAPADLAHVNHARDAAKRARKAAAITRRIGR